MSCPPKSTVNILDWINYDVNIINNHADNDNKKIQSNLPSHNPPFNQSVPNPMSGLPLI